LVAAAVVAAAAPGASLAGPADQPPFGGEAVQQRVPVLPDGTAPGFRLTREEAERAALDDPGVESLLTGDGPRATAFPRGEIWEVEVDASGDDELEALVEVDDATGEVLDVWTEEQIETKLARGYEDAVAGDVNEWWFWLPLCLAFFLPFFDPRRPLRLLHLDLLALLGFSVSLFFFNKGETEASSLLVYPPLLYLLARSLIAGFRRGEKRERLVPLAPRSLLVAGIAALVALQTWFAIDQAKVIDVGVAGVIGADRITDGEDVWSESFGSELPESGDVRGDVYGHVNYLAYVPAEWAWPWEDEWDDVPAARYSSLAFSLLTALALFGLGRRLRPWEEGAGLGIALAYAWLAYPFTLYTLGSSFNDSLVALLIVIAMLVLSSAPARGAMAALGGLTKFGTLALAPLFAAGTGDRRPRTLLAFTLAFLAAAALVTLPLLPDGGLREVYDRSLGYQASRGSPFSLWGQVTWLDPLQTLVKVLAVGLAVAVFFVPRRRDAVQVAALGAAVLIAVQLTANHWFYPYAIWFAPLVLAAVFAAQRGAERPVSA
jgi:Glycosyltransferase family 87